MERSDREYSTIKMEEADEVHECPVHELGDGFFEMTTIEHADAYFFKGMHRHDFYEMLWFTDVRPEQVHYIDFDAYPITANQVFLLLPGQVHNMEQRGKNGFLLAISKDFFDRVIGGEIFWLLGCSGNFSVVIPDRFQQVLNTLMELIRQEHAGERRPAILESYLRSWFLHCIDVQKQLHPPPHSDPRLQALIEFIEINYRQQRHADFYAKLLSMSAKRLNEITRESFGKTISQMINDRLILEAKRRIGYIEKPIKEISYELGFSEPSYFTRFFGKQTGIAPLDFRKRIVAQNQ